MARAVSGVQAPFSGIRRYTGTLALCAAASLLVVACSETGNGSGATRAVGSSGLGGGAARVIERDIEAPEIFSMEEAGLWDGRPSLGGVWVAHPEASDPERVMIRNAQTGETVVGALFRRERENPGPRFQISSEAANALGILPGQPTTIRVVALQLQQIETDPEPQQRPAQRESDATPEDESAAVRPAGAELAETRPDTRPESGADAGAEAVTVAIEDEEPERPRGLRALFSRRSTSSGAGAVASAPDIAMTSLPDAGSMAPAAPRTQPEIEASAQTEAPARERRGRGGLFSRSGRDAAPEATEPQSAALIPLPEDGPEPATQPSASALDRPFVQIGIFSVEANALGARERMQQAGLSAEIRRGRMNDNQFWRVVVGPAQDRAGQAAMLERVREMGFGDAYTVAR